jgi:hypothetical protein
MKSTLEFPQKTRKLEVFAGFPLKYRGLGGKAPENSLKKPETGGFYRVFP